MVVGIGMFVTWWWSGMTAVNVGAVIQAWAHGRRSMVGELRMVKGVFLSSVSGFEQVRFFLSESS